MAIIIPDLDAPIVPNYGLGGFELRTSLIDIQESFSMLKLLGTGSAALVDIFEARYIFGTGELTVCVDVRNGKVFKIIAGPGYRGRLDGAVGVGMIVSEAALIIPALYYDGIEESIYYAGTPGVTVDVQQVLESPDLVPNEPITAISVYAVEAFEFGAGKGRW